MNKKLLIILSALCALALLCSACTQQTPSTEQEAESASPSVTETEKSPSAIQSVPEPSSPSASDNKENEEQEAYTGIVNPVVASGADPWVILHEGSYYYCFANGNTLHVSSFESLAKMDISNAATVYTAPAGTAYSSNYWAPELHYIDGSWYIYVAADNGDNFNHRMYVLKGTTQDPRDPFEMVGKISDPSNKWAIDGTVLQLGGELYFAWSGWEGNENVAQNIYIAHMSDPCTIDSERVLLSTPTYGWEKVGDPHVNEGPTFLTNGDRVFLVYSASGSWTDNYCLGMLTLTGEDLLNPEHWEKAEKPVFKQLRGLAYGPGHCSFAPAGDGSIWMIYHANLVSGSSWAGRSVWLAPVSFEEDGTPEFGKPARVVKFPTKGLND